VGIQGFAAPRFARVREAFEQNLASLDVGAACCVYHRGEAVVDLYGGFVDRDSSSPWRDETIALVFSTTKGATAICAHMLVERGQLDLDAPIARYWPEFAAQGKGDLPVRWVLCHKAGLAEVLGGFTIADVVAWDPVVDAIAAQAPIWEPGTAHGYHARSYGWILGELTRRITSRSLGRFFAEEIAEPLGIDFWIGLPEAEEPRVAQIIPPEPPVDPASRELIEKMMGPETLLGRVLSGPSDLFRYDERWNGRELHAAEMPSSNGIGSARAIARMYAATIGEIEGVRLLAPDTLAAACAPQASGPDKVLLMPVTFGLGFMLAPTVSPAASPAAFGHPGAGGSLGLADPEAELALGYVMNQMHLGVTDDPRARALVRAAYESLRD
jgi:CubicO group peptidase (beta-lactamase class C family)